MVGIAYGHSRFNMSRFFFKKKRFNLSQISAKWIQDMFGSIVLAPKQSYMEKSNRYSIYVVFDKIS